MTENTRNVISKEADAMSAAYAMWDALGVLATAQADDNGELKAAVLDCRADLDALIGKIKAAVGKHVADHRAD